MQEAGRVRPIQAHSSSLTVPVAAVKYILLQRTRLQKLHYLSNLLHLPYYPLFAQLESAWRGKKIAEEFSQVVQREYETIKAYLPPFPKKILDIGCGMAGIDIALFRHYGNSADLTFHLLDRSEISPSLFYGFRNEAAFYNSLDIARSLLIANGVSGDNVVTSPATPDYRLGVRNIDLVISLLAWGFHFPIRTYLAEVHASMNDDARLIVDVRRGTTGETDIHEQFGNSLVIAEGEKAVRITAVRNSTSSTR